MRPIIELSMGIKDSPELRKKAMEMMQFMFTKSQENLVIPMPWGDETDPSDRRQTAITDEGILLASGIPPYWEGDSTIVFEYQAPHAGDVEWGTPPHTVGAKRLVGWVNRKLAIRGKAGMRVAYAVANKIRKKGIEPHPYIRPAANAMETHYGMKRK